MKKVVITEKPSVAMAYVKTIAPNAKRNDGFYEDDNFIITWAVGHLVAMSYPEKYNQDLAKWDLNLLPFLPEEYKYEIIARVKKQFGIIKKILHRKDIDCIYYAGDAGREGVYIQALIRQEAGHTKGVRERVVWIDSQTEDEIKRGIKEAKPIDEYLPLIASGYERAIEDYAMGINITRALSIKYKKTLNNSLGITDYKKMKPVTVGRVMTCVLGMIVEREREIRNFKETPFYGIKGISSYIAEWKTSDKENPKLYSEKGFKSKEDAEALIKGLSGTATVSDITKSAKKKYAPLFFNLAELQSEMSKQFKISPDETLEIAQSLYEKKLITYPRTDARVLSTPVAKEIHKNLLGLQKGELGKYVSRILELGHYKGFEKTHYVDDDKVSDHYAIIPTGIINGVETLNDNEKTEYTLICKRFLAPFCPPFEWDETIVDHIDNNEHFFTKENITTAIGWKALYGEKKENNVSALSNLKKGDKVSFNYEISEGKTTPPKRYTSGSIILAMETAGKLIEDEELREQIKGTGIGTSATRGEIYKKLLKNDHIVVNKKTQILTPTKFGESLYELVNLTVPSMLKPNMTASWEKGLDQIAKKQVSAQDYRKKLNGYVAKLIQEIKTSDVNVNLTERLKKV